MATPRPHHFGAQKHDCGWTVVVLALVLLAGCAPKFVVVAQAPNVYLPASPANALPASLFVENEVASFATKVTRDSGDIGIGPITADFQVGSGLTSAIWQAARHHFASITAATADGECTSGAALLIVVGFAGAPHVDIWWKSTAGVGGGTEAEFPLQVSLRHCDGSLVACGSAVAHGRTQRTQALANWPGPEEFQPGVDAALEDVVVQVSGVLSSLTQRTRLVKGSTDGR